MAIAESPALKPGGQVKVVFTLPGQIDFFTFDSEVCWYDDKGRAGLRSLTIPSEQHSTLQNWLGTNWKKICRNRWHVDSEKGEQSSERSPPLGAETARARM